jgi:hypothetical protein
LYQDLASHLRSHSWHSIHSYIFCSHLKENYSAPCASCMAGAWVDYSQ